MIELSSDRVEGYEAALRRPGGNLLISGRDGELIRIDPLDGTALHDMQRSVRLIDSRATEPLPVGRYRLTPDGDNGRAIDVEVTEGGRPARSYRDQERVEGAAGRLRFTGLSTTARPGRQVRAIRGCCPCGAVTRCEPFRRTRRENSEGALHPPVSVGRLP